MRQHLQQLAGQPGTVGCAGEVDASNAKCTVHGHDGCSGGAGHAWHALQGWAAGLSIAWLAILECLGLTRTRSAQPGQYRSAGKGYQMPGQGTPGNHAQNTPTCRSVLCCAVLRCAAFQWLTCAAACAACPAALPARVQAKTTKKIVLRLACTVCKAQHMHAIKVRGRRLRRWGAAGIP